MEKYLHFHTSANIKDLVGKNLVTDEITALFELVKNSYDADAEEVTITFKDLQTRQARIVIKDTGIGMDMDDILKKWMVIGTDSKKDKLFSDLYQRPLNGDKGIGRFSTDRLGSQLKLMSIKKNSDKIIGLVIDWTKFENSMQNVEDVDIHYSVEPISPNSQSGLTLIIRDLRDKWDKDKIQRLIKNLQSLKSPFASEDNFKINVIAGDYYDKPKVIESHKLENISSLWVKTEIPIEDTSIIKIVVNRNGILNREEYPNPYDFGAIKTEVYFFNTGDKIAFKNRLQTRVVDFGNIRLYRDDFRVYPYGESYNDWLDLDRRKAQGFARFAGSRDLVGSVQIYKKYNSEIVIPTNRQGIIENEYAAQLRKCIIEYSIKILEKYHFKAAKNETYTESKVHIDNSLIKLNQLAKDLKKVAPTEVSSLNQIIKEIKTEQIQQNKFVKDQEELISVYKRTASKELLLNEIIHQSLIKTENILTVTDNAIRELPEESITKSGSNSGSKSPAYYFAIIQRLANDAVQYLKPARDHLIRKRDPKKYNIVQIASRMIQDSKETLVENNIEIKFKAPSEVYLRIDKNDFQTIMENFINNSVKALKTVTDRRRNIKIIIVETERFVVLNFRDNGPGIPEHLRQRIFDPFFSTTAGFGMGLSIVDEIVKEYNGSFNLAKETGVGAEFQIQLRK